MKIGIDCRLSGITHAGIGRYIENLIMRLPRLAPDIEWVYFYRQQNQILPELDVEYIQTPIRHYTFQEQLQLLSIFNREKLDLLHVPHFNVPVMYAGKLVVTIHDLLWHQQKGAQATTLKAWEYWGKYLGYRFVASQAIKKASQILVPAQTIKKTLNQYYPGIESKITVTHEGVAKQLLKFKKLRVVKKKNSLIYVGSLYPHKNIHIVIKALAQLPSWQLLIVGARNIFQDQTRELVKKYGVEKQIKFVGFLADEVLAKEIKAATALVQPSLSEGFGLTGIEAMALGTPVLASNIPIFKEIYQNDAIYFNPQSTESFITIINKLPKKKLTVKQMQLITKKYSWDEMTKKTIKIYRSLLQ